MASKNLENLRKFVAPEFVFGVGARKLSGRYLDNLGIKKVLIVTDEGVKNAGWLDKITISLEERDIDYVIYDNVSPNPRDYEVADGSEIYLKNKCSGIIAIGGGSPMDAAKGIGIVSSNGGNILDYEGVDEIKTSIPPLVCVPTTSGSSADVSQFAIITDTKRKVKIAIISKAVVPDVSLIDPETATTMDKDLTAATGLDALTHAVEALVS
nr:iron-containing alcohol dehydrogenase [Spirochaetota bacterium]